MNVEEKLRSIHKEIQQKLTKMIPEKYKQICLYASVLDGSELSRGEMFFYYFPSGILKKNPINVYEIPKLFDFDEDQYKELEDRLYEVIRKLKKYCVKIGQRPWSNLTITIKGTRYIVEYNYDDLEKSAFDNYERHIVWRYKYLKLPIEAFSKSERQVIQKYYESEEYKDTEISTYEENVYEKQVNKVAVYSTVENHEEYGIKEEKEAVPEQSGKKNQLLNF